MRPGRQAPRDAPGVVRRAFFFALVSWVPIVVWASVTGHLYGGTSAEPLLRHFGVHVRCLIAIPLMIVADAPFLVAPELGPAADVATLYQLATSIRTVPIGKAALLAVLVPAAVPLLIVAALELPLKDVLLKLVGALV